MSRAQTASGSGPRKVGMPLAWLTPAPVTTSIRPGVFSMVSARESMSLTGAPHHSKPLKFEGPAPRAIRGEPFGREGGADRVHPGGGRERAAEAPVDGARHQAAPVLAEAGGRLAGRRQRRFRQADAWEDLAGHQRRALAEGVRVE